VKIEDRIVYRQKQCSGCKFKTITGGEKGGLYGFCTKQNKRFCDIDIWEDCKYFERKE